jgi:hypothetical protein
MLNPTVTAKIPDRILFRLFIVNLLLLVSGKATFPMLALPASFALADSVGDVASAVPRPSAERARHSNSTRYAMLIDACGRISKVNRLRYRWDRGAD